MPVDCLLGRPSYGKSLDRQDVINHWESVSSIQIPTDDTAYVVTRSKTLRDAIQARHDALVDRENDMALKTLAKPELRTLHEVDRKDLDNLFREQSVDNSVSKDVHSEDEAESNISIEKELENPLSLEKERSVESENVTNAESVSLDEFENVLSRDRQQLISDQQSDVNLKSLPIVEYMTKDAEGYFYKDGLLMHRFRPSQYNNLNTF